MRHVTSVGVGRRATILSAAALTAGGGGGRVALAHVPPAGNWSLLSADEFNGTSLDQMKWNYNYPWSQHGLADDSVEQPSQVSVANGVMSLTAIASGQWYNNNWYDYTSGAVNTQGKLNFTYGYIEASQKMPSQQGTWPAFWMLQNGWPPEIDIQEVPAFGSNTTSYSSGYHYSNSAGAASSAGPGIVNKGVNLSAAFHTYGVDWEPTSLTFYFDGSVTGSISGSQANIAQAAGQYLLLDLGVGGWPGNPPAGTAFPAVMQTDWVRVWQQLPGGAATSSTAWTKAAGGGWDDATAWNNGLPTVSATTAVFGNLTGAPATATVAWSGSRTVGGLTFSSATKYTLAAAADDSAGVLFAPADGVPTAAESVGLVATGTGTPTVNARLELPYALLTLVVTNVTPAPIPVNGSLIGPGNLTLSGSGGLTLNGNDQLTGNHAVAGGTLAVNGRVAAANELLVANGTLQLNPGSAVVANAWTSIGSAAGGTGRLVLSGGTLTANTDFNVGDVSGSTGVATVSGGTLSATTLYVGKSGTAVGTLTQSGGTIATLPGAGDWRIGGAGSSADAAAVGTLNLSGGTFTDGSNLQVGAYGRGTVNQTGGTATVANYLAIGRFPGGVGVYNLSAGTLTSTLVPDVIVGQQGTGTLLVSGTGTVNAKGLYLSFGGGVGSVAQTGGTVNAPAGVSLASAGGTASYTLAGGLLATAAVAGGAGTGTLTLNGGTLRATANSAAFVAGGIAARVGFGGAVLDTNGFAVTIPQPLVSAGSTDGGLTKVGLGTLTLSGANTYAGPTTVAAGTLAVTGSVAGSAVTVNPGAALTVAGGTLPALTVNGAATVPATTGRRSLLVTPSVAGTGTLDLTDNDLDVANGNLAAVSALVAAGTITSSTAATDPTRLTTLGVILNNDGTGRPLYSAATALGTVDGTSPAATDVLVRYTYFGDADLNGRVDGADYARVDAGYALGLTGWANGDFNGDGKVDGSDYTLIDNAYNLQAAGLVSSITAASTDEVAAVPEPAAVGLLGGVALLAARRSRAVSARARRYSDSRLAR